ncbi:TPA: hypothetical protein DEO28_03555 [Candidatus Dependentiae bacterium]|nr:MAG: Magnesium-translocating P-type ATPase [candidate division TM6 bacterium GW2011_GWE2_31_21]KKP53627.1 MAG: Magnesium-translocating P-type ATPase [candidate division TM6 bacterium GW2011_GWF2_33_332]HBS48133.1 hypothetical protein [Candidatus Dependentiae bacterium]HBZ73557.1 hypothetical protein [Candidatus Dependentiae bacterium]
MESNKWVSCSVQEALSVLKTSQNGLSSDESSNRLKIYGLNEIKEKEVGLLNLLCKQFQSPFLYFLVFAALLSLAVGEHINFFVILSFIFFNVFLSFYQEAKANLALKHLKKFLKFTTKVMRDGNVQSIDKTLLVPGDIVLLETGNIVPADIRVIESKNLFADESVLFGESIPVAKIADGETEQRDVSEYKNILFAASTVVSGSGIGVVVATGKNSEFGEIEKLVSNISRESIYARELAKFSKIVLVLAVSTILLIFGMNVWIKGGANFIDFANFFIVLLVGIVPEALPAVVTFALSQGALALAKENVLVKRLSSIQDLGDIEILCSDKTGTLTENILILEDVFAENKDECLFKGLLSSSYLKNKTKPISGFDSAIFNYSKQDLISKVEDFKLIAENPFDPVKMQSSVEVQNEKGEQFLIVKGAAELLLNSCSSFLKNYSKESIEKELNKFGQNGRRTLGIAIKKIDNDSKKLEYLKDLQFIGFFIFYDPIKESAKETTTLAATLGVKIKIITGDAKDVSCAVAKDINLISDDSLAVVGKDLENLSQEDFAIACEKYAVFARISPSLKYKIIESLQAKYEVGFLGEGMNDTPALKAANVGIAVEGAIDVAKDVSDIILLKKDLLVLIKGIKEGRAIFSNINKYIKVTIASNFGNFYSMALISLLFPFLPMLPIQILLLNLLSDLPLIAIATDSIDLEELQKPKLNKLSASIFLILIMALASSIFDFIFFGLFYSSGVDRLRTMWFILSTFTEVALIFSLRTTHFFARATRPSSFLIGISAFTILTAIVLPFSFVGQKLLFFVRPLPKDIWIIVMLGICYFVVSEIAKQLYYFFANSRKRNRVLS